MPKQNPITISVDKSKITLVVFIIMVLLSLAFFFGYSTGKKTMAVKAINEIQKRLSPACYARLFDEWKY